MIIAFGSIHIEIHMHVEAFAENEQLVAARQNDPYPGGKAPNQAFAAARAGAEKIALVGHTGDDEFSVALLNKLRQEGIMTSGVAKTKTPTGLKTIIEDKNQRKRIYYAAGANALVSVDQVPEEILNEKSVVLLQTEVSSEQNIALLNKAKEYNATTIMNLSPSRVVSETGIKKIDYLIVNRTEAHALAVQLGLTIGDNDLKLAEAFSRLGELNCIVTKGSQGAVAYTKEGKAWECVALPLEKVVDTTGAEDAYCGTFAAAIQNGLSLPEAMKRSSIAATLTCTKAGSTESFPHLDDILENLDKLEDPKEITI